MKATGIVRRIDDLGRVVIPKGIRRTMHIREGDSLEIYTDTDGQVVFKKYSPIGEMGHLAAQYADTLARVGGRPVLVADRDRIIASAGCPKREVIDRVLSDDAEAHLMARRRYLREGGAPSLFPLVGSDHEAVAMEPILAAGDVVGAVLLLSTPERRRLSECDTKLAQVAATLLGKQLEEI